MVEVSDEVDPSDVEEEVVYMKLLVTIEDGGRPVHDLVMELSEEKEVSAVEEEVVYM